MDPVKIKLRYEEAHELLYYLYENAAIAKNAQAEVDLIVLSEFLVPAARQDYTISKRLRTNYYQYTMPLSVARILHRRWQDQEISHELQMVLSCIDKELTNRGLKPDPDKPIII